MSIDEQSLNSASANLTDLSGLTSTKKSALVHNVHTLHCTACMIPKICSAKFTHPFRIDVFESGQRLSVKVSGLD